MESDVVVGDTLVVDRVRMLVSQARLEFIQLGIGNTLGSKPCGLALDCQPCLKHHEEILQHIAVDQVIQTLLVIIQFKAVVGSLDNLLAQGCYGTSLEPMLLDISKDLELIQLPSDSRTA